MSSDDGDRRSAAPRSLAGKRIVVTGASRGLGRAAAVAFAANGADVVINGRDASNLERTRDLVLAQGGRCEPVVGSVAEYASCEATIERCLEAFGGVDCLLNNAGITRDRTLAKMSEQEFDEVVAVNLRGSWACGKLAAAAMRESGGGSIVNVVSNTAFQGAIGQTNYGASKAAVAGMTRTWTLELSRYGIRVNAIWPIALTDMTAGLAERMIAARSEANGGARVEPADIGLGAPEDVARIAVFLADDRSSEINGQVITFNGRKLALWSHPREVEIVERDRWSVDGIAAAFADGGPLSGRLQELYEAF